MRLRRILVVSLAVACGVVVLSRAPAEAAPAGDGPVPETTAPPAVSPAVSDATDEGAPDRRESPWLPAGIGVAATAVAGLLYLSRS